jgi:hypothetical protein
LLTLYLACFAFGAVFVGASAFMGNKELEAGGGDADVGGHDADASGHDATFDHDHDHDLAGHDGAGDHPVGLGKELTLGAKDLGAAHQGDALHDAALTMQQAAPLAPRFRPLLSLRFWTYALTAFGLAGALCRLLSVPFFLELPAALLLGLTVGLSAAFAIHSLKVSTVSTDQNLKSLVGGEATVVLPVSAGQLGKVRMRLGDQDVELTATTREETPIPRGTTAFVIAMNGERVEVASIRSLDPISAKQRARVAPPQAR